ncbi:MAG: TetR/AcrR family transcriptional regulator [Spirochaetales bacterium]|nr:TetR/AcrR family transcriptional regulator [Spirochaetales bacterium]
MKKDAPRMTGRRQVQAQKTRHQILTTALKLVEQKGFDKVTITEIARKAGVSKGLFYHYFQSKDDLIVVGYAECDAYFENHVRGKLKGKRAWDRIMEFIHHQMLYAQNLGIDLITQTYKSQIQYGTEFFTSPERSLPSILRQIVEEGQNQGELAEHPSAQYICQYLLRFSRGIIYDWCLHRGEFDLESTAQESLARLEPLFKKKT